MKLSLVLLAVISIFIFGNKIYEDKKYKVEFTQQEWQARYNWIEAAKAQLRQSDLPSKTVIFINDSLLGKFQNELAIQLQPQFLAAADTTKKKK